MLFVPDAGIKSINSKVTVFCQVLDILPIYDSCLERGIQKRSIFYDIRNVQDYFLQTASAPNLMKSVTILRAYKSPFAMLPRF